MTDHDLFLKHRAEVERALQVVCRRQSLGTDADDFCSAFRIHLLADNCRILRVFQGRSSLDTYLVTVVTRYFQDWRNARWGKWRTSAEARRLGSLAIELEMLLVRDRLSMDEAVEMLRTRRGITESRDALEAIAARLPARQPRTLVSDESLEQRRAAPDADADALIQRRDAERMARQAQAALAEAMTALPAQDRLIVRLHCADDVSIADIARMLQVDQKPLYRRVERLKAQLRDSLSKAGLSAEAVTDLIAAGGLGSIAGAEAGNALRSVRPTGDTGASRISSGRTP